jgi:foldase protein PrsA
MTTAVMYRCFTALCVVAVAGLAACGVSSSHVTVAYVSGVGSISRATLDHWIPVVAIGRYQVQPTKVKPIKPIPSGVVPDPPDYTACIAYLKVTSQKLGETGPKPTTEQLKGRCRHRYQELKMVTLNTLIGWEWTIGAGLAQGINVPDAEAKQWLEEGSKRSYPMPGEFALYRKLTRQTFADMLFRSRVELFQVKLVKIQAALQMHSGWTAQRRQRAVAQFLKAMPPSKQWAARTTCRAGYVVSACKQYKGPESPGLSN